MPALLRAGATNEGAAERLRAIFTGQLHPFVTATCPDSDQSSARAALIASQMLGLALCRYIVRLPPMVDRSTHI